MKNSILRIKRRSLAVALVLALSTGTVAFAASDSIASPNLPTNIGANHMPPGPPPEGGMPGGAPGGQHKTASDLSATVLVDGESQSLDRHVYASGITDESAVLVRGGGSLNLSNAELHKQGDSSSADASNFNGQNAVFLCADNSTAHLSDIVLESDADGSNAIFSTGEKSVVTAEHIKIHTKNNSSRGLDATYGGTIKATDVEIVTEGAHCGALATDRGEGNVLVSGANIKTSGEGSPCIYSTGNIQLTNGVGEATGSEIAVVEGKNSITLNNADLTGHIKHGVMLYQSFSGDAGVGMAKFTANDSKLTNQSPGPMFYVTNTIAEASLKNTQLVQAGGSKTLVQVTSDRWGVAEQNGGNFTLNAENQLLEGAVLANRISQVTLNLGDGAVFSGSANPDNQADSMVVNLKSGAAWELTEDSYVTTLIDEDGSFSNIKSNGHNIYYSKAGNSFGGKTIKLPGGGKLMAH